MLLSGVLVASLGVNVCAPGVTAELATLAANAGVVSMVAVTKMAAIFLFIVILRGIG